MSLVLKAAVLYRTGRIERGVIKAGDEVEVIGLHHQAKKVVVTSCEMFHKILMKPKPAMPLAVYYVASSVKISSAAWY